MKKYLVVNKKFEKLFNIFTSDNFLNSKGLAGEVPFYISDFEPDLQNEVDKAVNNLKKRLFSDGIEVLEINLYDLSIELLKVEEDLEYILENEQSFTNKKDLLDEIQKYLDIHDVVIPAIAEKISSENHNIVFITGVGLVFPFIRSHNILNNLQKVSKKPTVMFFPGKYIHHGSTGSSLNLFGKLMDDRYYRAKDLEDLYKA
ncbi:MAG: DUF1788 domain-containing protein [Victivallales bacterium]|nr:DUF1788 domain-containing protein [Victivallales bacterium]